MAAGLAVPLYKVFIQYDQPELGISIYRLLKILISFPSELEPVVAVAK